MIVKKPTEEEIALIELIRHPIWCGELIHELEQKSESEKVEYSQYQKLMLCDFNNFVSICCGRSIGKTFVLTDKITWLALNKFYDEPVVYTIPNRAHLEQPFLKWSRWFRNHPLLKHFSNRNSINRSDWQIKLINGFILDCRIAGQTGTGAPVVSLHVPFVFLDESAFYPYGTFIELLPIINTYQAGFQLFVSGVPDGRRERSVCFNCDQVDSTFTHHRVSAHENPRYTEEDETRSLARYKSKDSEEYIHMVLGQHGQPVYAMFDRNFMKIEDYEFYFDSKKGQDFKDNSQFIYTYISTLPQLPPFYEHIIMGVDLGYTEPTVITIMYKLRDLWYFHSRISLYQVDYPTQERIIDLMDTKYKPGLIGIDAGAGGSGKSVIQHLQNDDQFINKNYKAKIVGIEFGGKTSIGFDDLGEQIFVPTKQFSMQKLQSLVNNKSIVFSRIDNEMISELERTRYTRTENNIKYSVESFNGREGHGSDHNTASLLCALLAWTEKYEIYNDNTKTIKLYSKVRWWD